MGAASSLHFYAVSVRTRQFFSTECGINWASGSFSFKETDLERITFHQFMFLKDGLLIRLLRPVLASLPLWAWNGASFSVALWENLKAPRALSSIRSKGSVFFSRAYVSNEYLRLPTVRSTHPVALWSLTGETTKSISSCWQKLPTFSDMKFVPWSTRVCRGTPCAAIYVRNNFEILSDLFKLQTMADGYLEKRSTATRTYFLVSFM